MSVVLKGLVFCTAIVVGLCSTGGYLEDCSCSTPDITTDGLTYLRGIPVADQSGCCSTPGYVCVSTGLQPGQDWQVKIITNFKCFPFSPASGATTEQNANYKGDYVIAVGTDNLQDSVEACQKSCEDMQGCNVFVYCGEPGGCKNGDVNIIPHKSCDLKMQFALQNMQEVEVWGRGGDIDFTSGTVERSLPCGYADGVPCCASSANQATVELGIDLMLPGGCDGNAGLYCDVSLAETGAEFGMCKTLDAASVCGTANGLCGSEPACDGYTTNCPSGYTCEAVRIGETMSAAGMQSYPYGNIQYCLKDPSDLQCGEAGQMCCPGALPSETDSRVTASCKGDNSMCVNADEFYSGRCYDYDKCGLVGEVCCPQLYSRVRSGTANSGNLDQCRDRGAYCDDMLSAFNYPGMTCKL